MGSNSPKTTQLVSGRGKFQTQAVWLQPLAPYPLQPLSEDFSCLSSEPRHAANA